MLPGEGHDRLVIFVDHARQPLGNGFRLELDVHLHPRKVLLPVEADFEARAFQPVVELGVFIAGLSVAMAVGIPQTANAFAGCPAWIGQIFGNSEVIVVALTAILLNLILPKEKKEN